MLLITSSPRQFANCLSLLRVLFLLCACGSRDVSSYLPASSSSNSSAAPASLTVLASGNFVQSSSPNYQVNGEPSWLQGNVLKEDTKLSRRPTRLRQATLIEDLHNPINISISPTRTTLAPNQTLRLRAGTKGNTNHAIKWLVEG